MKMLLLVFRDSLSQEIRQLLNDLDVKAFTEAPKVLGTGEAGAAFDSFDWPGTNSMILSAIEEHQEKRIVEGLKRFRDQLAEQQHGAKIPLRVFVLPCEQMV